MSTYRIYYGDGSTYDGPVQDAPGLNVQVIVEKDPDPHGNGKFTIHGGGQRPNREPIDYYWWNDGLWFGGDIFGLWDYLTRPGWKKVLFGRSIADAEFQAILRRAIEDPDFDYTRRLE